MAPQDYVEALKTLMISGAFSDLVLACQGHEFHVHRAIVCSHSKFFMAACNSPFLESQSRRIELEDDDLGSLRRMISYMYTFDYKDLDPVLSSGESVSANETEDDSERSTTMHPDTKALFGHEWNDQEPQDVIQPDGVADGVQLDSNQQSTGDPELFSTVRVYAIAEKYGMSSLKELSRTRFQDWIQENWSSSRLPAMAEEVFESTRSEDMGLRTIVADTVVEHLSELLKQSAWREVIENFGQLGLMMLKKMLRDESVLVDRTRNLETLIDMLERDKHALKAEHRSLSLNLNSRHQCRHCAVAFNVCIDEASPTTLRCRACRTRH